MKCIERLRQRVAMIGATVDDRDEYAIHIDAPSGYIWNASGGTSLTERCMNAAGQSWVAEACRMLNESAQMGLRKVTDQKQLEAIRYELDEDEWGAPENAPIKLGW